MGDYLTVVTMQKYYDPTLLANLTDDSEPATTIDEDNLNAAIDSAEDEFHSRIRQAYSTLPLSNITNDLRRHISVVAVYGLSFRRGNMPDWVVDAYELALRIFDRMGRERNIELEDGLANNDRITVGQLDLDDTDAAFTTNILGT